MKLYLMDIEPRGAANREETCGVGGLRTFVEANTGQLYALTLERAGELDPDWHVEQSEA